MKAVIKWFKWAVAGLVVVVLGLVAIGQQDLAATIVNNIASGCITFGERLIDFIGKVNPLV